MKIQLLILTFMSLTAGTSTVLAKGIESSMGGFTLNTCSENKTECLQVKAEKTQGSQLKPLHMLTRPEVTITSQKSAKTTVLHGDTGYIDLNENQLVLFKRDKGQLTETSINLTTLERFSTKPGDL